MTWKGGFTGVGYSRPEFRAWLRTQAKPAWVKFMVSHNTAAPYIKPPVPPATRIRNLGNYYKSDLGWSTGPNLVVILDKIYTGTPLAFPGTNSPGFNGKGLGIEVEGDYRTGKHDPKSGDGLVAWTTAGWAFAEVMEWLGLPVDDAHLKLHKEDPGTTHDCPGNLVNKPWLLGLVKDAGRVVMPTPTPTPAPTKMDPAPVKKPVLRKGSSGVDVLVLQAALQQHGLSIVVDGDFGPKTEQSVQSFQAHSGLVADGVVGPLTWAALAIQAAPAPTSSPTPSVPVSPPAAYVAIASLHPSEFAISWMKRFEGLRLVAYDDVGSWAIGYGHNATSKRPPIPFKGMTITEAEASDMLHADAESIAAEVRKVLAGIILKQDQFDALVLDCFQRGQTQFTKTDAVKALKEGREKDASVALHAQATTSKNAGLNRRRVVEAQIFDGEKPTKW